jgi:hypothetical protein
MLGARLATAGRNVLLRDLAAIAHRLSDDELRVLLTIADRARIGQAKIRPFGSRATAATSGVRELKRSVTRPSTSLPNSSGASEATRFPAGV